MLKRVNDLELLLDWKENQFVDLETQKETLYIQKARDIVERKKSYRKEILFLERKIISLRYQGNNPTTEVRKRSKSIYRRKLWGKKHTNGLDWNGMSAQPCLSPFSERRKYQYMTILPIVLIYIGRSVYLSLVYRSMRKYCLPLSLSLDISL